MKSCWIMIMVASVVQIVSSGNIIFHWETSVCHLSWLWRLGGSAYVPACASCVWCQHAGCGQQSRASPVRLRFGTEWIWSSWSRIPEGEVRKWPQSFSQRPQAERRRGESDPDSQHVISGSVVMPFSFSGPQMIMESPKSSWICVWLSVNTTAHRKQ